MTREGRMKKRSYWKIWWKQEEGGKSDDDGGVESRLERRGGGERRIPAHISSFFPPRGDQKNRGFFLSLALTLGVNKCNRIALFLFSFSAPETKLDRSLRHLWRKKREGE